MFVRSINPDTALVRISMRCPKCGKPMECEFDVPELEYYYSDKTLTIMPTFNWGELDCSCGSIFNVSIERTVDNKEEAVTISINDLPSDYAVVVKETDELEQSILHNKNCFETFLSDMGEIKLIIEENTSRYQQTINRMLFVQIVTCLETYLSDTLIISIDKDRQKLERFVSSFNDYKSKSIPYNHLIEEYFNLRNKVIGTLKEIRYHNIPKVQSIYKNVFGIEFPEVSEICKIIDLRHDLVHRNGKDKDGAVLTISKEMLLNTYSKVYEFVKTIEEEIESSI